MNSHEPEYEIIEEYSPDKYYTQFCNIIFHLGLDPYEIALYLAIKRTVGKNGKCFKSVRTLAEETGMGKTKVSETIKSLQRKHDLLRDKSLIKVISKPKKDGGGNLISITNIMPDNMLFFESQKVSAERTGCPPDGQGVRVANEGGTPSHIIDIKKEPLRKNPLYLQISEYLFSKIKTENPNHKPPNLNAWADQIQRMAEIDKRAPEEIKRMIDWIYSNHDPFWKTCILSTQKLREKYDQIFIQMKNPRKSNAPIGRAKRDETGNIAYHPAHEIF